MRLTLRFVALAVLAVSSPAAAGTPQETFLNGPYLQHLSPTSVDIRVELVAPGAATVEVGTEPGPEATKRTLANPSAVLQTFHLDGLSPATRYRYVVHAGAAVAPTGEFVTAPKNDSRAPFAFLIYGDTRSNDQVHAAVVKAITQQPFEFLVNTGDVVAAGGEHALWHDFFSIEKDLLRDHCVFACVGNHELAEDDAASNYLAYLGPNETGSLVPYGTFRWARARFFLLNAFQDWGQGELSWLQRELDKADTEPDLAWRIVVVHHSPWSSGRHGDDTKMLAAGVPELLIRHRVDLVVAGHDHIYERGESKGLKYLISGGGGAPLYKERNAEPSTRFFDASYNFVRASAEGDTFQTVAQRPDGSTIETCGFHRGEGWDCDAKPGSKASVTVPPSTSVSSPPTTASPPETKLSSRCGCHLPGARGGPDSPFLLGLGSLAFVLAWIRRKGFVTRSLEPRR
jgi:predicted phosphodiesterase